MEREVTFKELLSNVVDNRGRTCPTAPGGRPLIATNCITNDGLYPKYEGVRYIDEETYRTWFRGHPEPGDLLFVTKGSPGRVCMVPDPVDFCIAQDMVAIRADINKVYPRFLFALLRSRGVQDQIENLHVGTMIPHFKKGDFDKLILTLPDQSTQRFIGDLYFKLSNKIEANRRMNATLEALARALFKSWFVDFDLSTERTSADVLRSEGVLEIGDGYRAKNDEMGEPGLPFIRAGNLQGDIDTHDAEVLSAASVSRAGNKLSKSGDVAFTSKGTVGRFSFVTDRTPQFVYSPQVCFWRSLDWKSLAPSVLYTWMLTGEFQRQIDAVATQTDMAPYVSLQDQRRMLVPRFPKEQQALALKLDHVLARRSLNLAQSRTLAQVRDLLLPKLLSGALRVRDAERMIGDAA